MLRMLRVADWFSLLNGFFGFMSIALAAYGRYQEAFILIVVGVLLDGVDGGLSRLGFGGGRLGGKLDSASDLVTFCVAPAFLLYHSFSGRPFVPDLPSPAGLSPAFTATALVLGACVLYFLTGMLRLARFDYLKGGERHDYFIGVTTPGAATVLASLALLQWDLFPSLLLVGATSFLMVSRVRLPKVRGPLVIPAFLALAAAIVLTPQRPLVGPVILLVCFLFYLLLGPGYVRRRLDEDELTVPF